MYLGILDGQLRLLEDVR